MEIAEFPKHTVQGVKMAQKSDLAGSNVLCEMRPPTRKLCFARIARQNSHLSKPSGTH